MRYLLSVAITLFCSFSVLSQSNKKHLSLKDSIDGKLDLSDYIIDANGFVPVPMIITEPALGGFGGAIIPVFIRKNPPYIDSIKGQVVTTPVAPDITGGIGLYTLNNTWAALAVRSGILVKSRIKYVIGGGYVNLNMAFYRTFSQFGEKKWTFISRSLLSIYRPLKDFAFLTDMRDLNIFFFIRTSGMQATVCPKYLESHSNQKILSASWVSSLNWIIAIIFSLLTGE